MFFSKLELRYHQLPMVFCLPLRQNQQIINGPSVVSFPMIQILLPFRRIDGNSAVSSVSSLSASAADTDPADFATPTAVFVSTAPRLTNRSTGTSAATTSATPLPSATTTVTAADSSFSPASPSSTVATVSTVITPVTSATVASAATNATNATDYTAAAAAECIP